MEGMKKTFIQFAAAFAVISLSAFVQAPVLSAQARAAGRTAVKSKAQRYVELVSGNDVLKSSVFGVLAMTEGGDTVASWNPGIRQVPASNLKLVTTGVALHQLGAGFKYVTRIGYSGKVVDGVLEGDLYIVGGGDPTIASKDSIAIPRNILFSQWRSFLASAGIKKINGKVIGDGRYFDGPVEDDTWSYQDIGTADGAGSDGLCFYENTQDIKVSPGPTAGSPVNVVPSFPHLPWMKYSNVCRTGAAGTGDKLYLFASEYVPYAEIRGTFAIDRRAKTENFANKFGAYTCAHYFCEYLKSKGVAVTQGPADVRLGRIRTDLSSQEYGPYATRVDDLKMIGSTYSPTLKKIARETNFRSDNFYAEMMFRTLGRRMHHSASYDSSRVAVAEVLQSLGANPSSVRISDGSGLSRLNYISPEFLVKFLSAMMDSPVFEDYIETIAQPGERHYESRLNGEKGSVKSRIHLKSGSMNGVRCFSGYIEPSVGSKSETIIFSIMTSNSLAKVSLIDPVIDRLLTLLASDN